MCASKDTERAGAAVNVFVTGQPGIGKTTLVLNVAKQLPQDCIAGFYTVEAKAPGTGEKLGLDVVTFSGDRAPLCRLRRGCGPKIGKYYVAISDFERVVLPQLTPSKKIKLHIVDEIGRLELCSDKFREAVFRLLDSPRAVFGSLPAPRYGHTMSEVEDIKQRADTAVLTLTKNNRAFTAQEVTELLKRLIQDASQEDDHDDVPPNESSEKERVASGADESQPCGSNPEANSGHRKADVLSHNVHEGGDRNQCRNQDDTPTDSLQEALAMVADAILD